MVQNLLIGFGGFGSRVVNNVVKELHLNKKEINDGEIFCAVLDTSAYDIERITDSNTGVHAFCISKQQTIHGILKEYQHLHMDTWCPMSENLFFENMANDAGMLRVKSRIAFMDYLESGRVRELESMINDTLRINSDSGIRITIVSSLAGGTGSGMFIQVALWLRKFLSECRVDISGVFILPDVLTSTIEDARNNNNTKIRLYGNTYAAIRELNAITNVAMNESADLSEKIRLDDLFDSIRDKATGTPVYDRALLVDSIDENGASLESIDEYEKAIAQLVYMRINVPRSDLYFFEDGEQVYGSCGIAKAVYPTESVKSYCALRATQDYLSHDWIRIDEEIDELIKEKKRFEKSSAVSNELIDRWQLFIDLFDEKTSAREKDFCDNEFFHSISKETKNETKYRSQDGKIMIRYTDRVEDFLKLLNSKKIDSAIEKYSGTYVYTIDSVAFVADDFSFDELMIRIEQDKIGLDKELDTFDKNVEQYADRIVESVFSYNFGDVTDNNLCSVYGLLINRDLYGTANCIHPIVARYLLYKLMVSMDRVIKEVNLKLRRIDALSDTAYREMFDNLKTRSVETTPEEYLNSRKWYQGKKAFLDEFKDRYALYINRKISFCDLYERECLLVSVYKKLIQRITDLVNHFEVFFGRIIDVQSMLDDTLNKNIKETDGIVGKTMYIYGSKENKETIYQALHLSSDKINSKIHKSVIDVIYGKLCAERRPDVSENRYFRDICCTSVFVEDTIKSFREKIDYNRNNSEIVNMNIVDAICKARDSEISHLNQIVFDFDIFENDTVATHHSYRDVVSECMDKLYAMAAPFLIYNSEQPDMVIGYNDVRCRVFWGFNTEVYDYDILKELEAQKGVQIDRVYPKDELYCYREVYGIKAKNISKFNEINDGLLYTAYSEIVHKMVEDAIYRGERALVRTPHLDKNWHRILPYITKEKQQMETCRFLCGFWLAIAYGAINVDPDGKLFLRRSVGYGFDSSMESYFAITYKNNPVFKTDIGILINALRTDAAFIMFDIPKLEARFRDELENIVKYADSEVLKGLTTDNKDLNPINMISRYNKEIGCNRVILDAMLDALEMIANELAKYDCQGINIEETKYRICRKYMTPLKPQSIKNQFLVDG